MHKCTDKDYAKFNPPENEAYGKLEKIRKEGGLFCLDWTEHGHEIWGTWTNGKSYGAMDIMAVPCGYQYTAYDGTVERGREDCNWDKEKLIEYLGASDYLNIYSNQSVLDMRDFGSSKLKKISVLGQVTIDPLKPNYEDTQIKRHEVVDEVSLLQLGFSEEN